MAPGSGMGIRTITGDLKPARGDIQFSGRHRTALIPQIVELGISQIPEGRQLFPFMTVKDNLDLGSYPRRARQDRDQVREWVYTLFPVLKERASQLVGSMSGGEQQMLAIGRGVMASPRSFS